ncbi:VC0807 family protein [Oligoflexus tunisiensis]|uniref:VC0807 family protein n=1 Tax=Oligoflexus tunisiensis TaxID=708132 RepID=UPI000A92E94F|nr:VC0807 family protein [Oligoflexus tunisiensis]
MDQKNAQENPFVSIVFNIALPVLILNKFSTAERLGPVKGLILALSFPIIYSIWDFAKRRHISFISGLGFISILLTGVFTLVHLPVEWIAIKEAAIPSLIGIAIIVSMRTESPLVKKLLYNDKIINVDLVESRLESTHHKESFERLLGQSSYLLAGSFLVSAILNFVLARVILKSPTGTPEFNEQLSHMQALSWPVIVIPSMAIMMFALFRLMKGIKELTGLETEEVLKTHEKPTARK